MNRREYDTRNRDVREEMELARAKAIEELIEYSAEMEGDQPFGLAVTPNACEFGELCDSHESDTIADRLVAMERKFTAQITALQLGIVNLDERVKRVEGLCAVQPTLEHGLLPPLATLSLVEVQIFHKPELTKLDKQGRHTHWSLRLNVSIGGQKLKKAVNVGLYGWQQFSEQIFGMSGDIPPNIRQWVETDFSTEDTLFGMLNMITKGKGSPRCRTQFAVLDGSLTDQPQVYLSVDDETALLSSFRPGKGTQESRAKWYGSWKP